MADTTAASVSSLRKRTGVSILECKKALDEAGGDEEKAIELLRQRGVAQAAKRAERDQSEGLIFSAEGDGVSALVFLKCETDFVARDENFVALGEEIVQSLLSDGEDAANKLAEEKMTDAGQKLGENISLGEMHRIEGDTLGSYVHSNSKIGVVVGLKGGNSDIAKDVAMHAAAMNPLYVSPDDVPAEEVEKEKNVWKEQLASEGKPEEIIEKIMMGKEKKFREENALVSQEFVKDPSKTIEQYLEGSTIEEYVRAAVG